MAQKICPVKVDVSDALEQCGKFSEAMGKRNQSHEFQNKQTRKRTPEQIAKDHLIGKMAEVAVYRVLTDLGAKLNPVDFTILSEEGVEARDEHDLVSSVNGMSISVKSTEKGIYLFIHDGQAKWNKAHAFVLCQTEMKGRNATGKVTILGFAQFADMFNSDQFNRWRESKGEWPAEIVGSRSKLVRKGEKSPVGNFDMQSTNVYANSGTLRHDLSELVAAINRPRPELGEATQSPPSSES